MAIRIAVLTDALSDQYFFPIWRRYYGGLFGDLNLFLVTYAGAAPFSDAGLGGVIRLPVSYDDATRATAITDLVAMLLAAYDVVVRVDVDEFLVVDPRVAPDIRTYIEATNRPYDTARGFDVVQMPDEPPLRPGLVLPQRGVAYANTALNKTAIVRTPLHWSVGFHWCSAYPECGPLFLLHLKRIDIDWQLSWVAEMTRNIAGNPAVTQEIQEYYRSDREKILEYHRGIDARPIVSGIENWYRDALQWRFFDAITYNAKDDVYYGKFEHDDALCEIPAVWKDML